MTGRFFSFISHTGGAGYTYQPAQCSLWKMINWNRPHCEKASPLLLPPCILVYFYGTIGNRATHSALGGKPAFRLSHTSQAMPGKDEAQGLSLPFSFASITIPLLSQITTSSPSCRVCHVLLLYFVAHFSGLCGEEKSANQTNINDSHYFHPITEDMLFLYSPWLNIATIKVDMMCICLQELFIH